MRKLILCNILILPTLFSCVEAAPAIMVTRILDGDTLEVKDDGELIRIRLVDIDAPEKSQPFGQRAKQKLSELVKDADGVAVSSTGKDRYGRTLAKVYVKKCQPACLAYYVNAEMVKSGLAWAYRYHGKATSPTMEELESRAKQAKTGLWSLPDAVEPWRYRYEHKTR
ncbi:Thermonuclease (plasmid) [Escherichia coli]|uniref:thermonuclease family protein n=1 Tax=Enterobacteriaceae TaxID=543 RepID=UPI000750F61A|nr:MULTISPECIES: thermonuclease family protein [Enterobacteriaceae]EBG3721374.1 thermonuclease family protein [Salmonella enterica]EBY5931338.1 thermonuclease family protein [Salmonella enterica subsp. enterica serovar Enteritidis]EIS9725544.1 thermonuclease family protein [Salmonella enterica subsp. enterica serovar Saintpaul]CAE6304493.1 Thermonuclease [Enterobacter cloacae]CAF9647740.1 Thermonuclease [Klebsiella pneumoniae]